MIGVAKNMARSAGRIAGARRQVGVIQKRSAVNNRCRFRIEHLHVGDFLFALQINDRDAIVVPSQHVGELLNLVQDNTGWPAYVLFGEVKTLV